MKLWCLQGVAYAASTLLFPYAAAAQITPDGSVGTTVTPNVEIKGVVSEVIDGGTVRGSNLFHSFSEFNIKDGQGAYFTNPQGITNILTRITGNNPSNINGILGVLGNANLFLLNPNGIIFGANAKLDLLGSFLATTANSIRFADGVEFSAKNPSTSPLLTVSVPIGLQFGQTPGGITVQASGHRSRGNIFTPLDRSNNPIGLQVRAGNTLALIGGEVNFSGGIAAVEGGGHLEVSGVSDGQVKLNPNGQGWVGDYSVVRQFNNIHLAQQSLLDASGSGGSIQLQGRNIAFTEGSAATIQNFGEQSFGGITVNATESLNLTGNIVDGSLGSLIRVENLGTGRTGNITISAAQLSMQNGGGIWNSTFTEAVGGNIAINVAGSIDVNGFVPADPTILSMIVTFALNSGNAGDITVLTGNLRLLNSGNLFSTTIGSGQAGTIRVNAADSIEIAGNNPFTFASSAMVSSTIGSGNANNMFINTSRLVVRDGGLLGSSALATGSAGSVTINASQSVEVTGRATGSILPSRIASFAEITDPAFQAAYGLPAIPSGDSGSLTINTPSLRIADGAFVSVKNDGPGRAGDLQINANSISLDNQGSITASTASGNGGNIRLNLQQNLLMRRNSLISATALGNGNGGNLWINAPVIVGLENSDIIANAVQGNGGNIQINTQSIFGLVNRPQLTPTSDITASSQFGLSGTVTISNPEVETRSFLVELPQNLLDTSEQITTGCAADRGNTFSITGRGGLPENPSSGLLGRAVWWDNRDLSALSQTAQKLPKTETSPEIVEATGWRINAQGQVELVADAASGSNSWQLPTNCQTLPLSSSGLRNLLRHLISSP
ncbi:two-partner secretion domain-containing protein [Microseira wollei]|uniref:Filamentous hemagglutinin family outer membrane protein n=1 Tax=Microseira wollei NIES-4236 TaxID=2530354 RepID=A0AAV3XMW7_9CYAN|nr:filamentous hemagglutinin N-terminal domain-containing protein [Microseira wollei]GET41827.1 filamentous hemagglutinin family outer membrane protein [Microseira wollei NIES-4236]